MKSSKISTFLAFLTFLNFPALSRASDYLTPRMAALGGSGRAGPLLNDSIFLNPSFASLLPTFSLALNYSALRQPEGRNYSVSIQDGRSELFQAGVAYTVREENSSVHFGVSKSTLRKLGFGVSGKLFFEKLPGGSQRMSHEVVLSTTYVPLPWFQAALVVDNALESARSLDQGLYREVALGVKFNVDKIVLVYVDPHVTPSLESSARYGHEAGLEFVMLSDFFLRIGNFRNSAIPYLGAARGNGWGTGFGWIGPRFSIDYGLSRALTPTLGSNHSMGMAFYF